MPKLIWEKKFQEAVKPQQRLVWSVSQVKASFFVQRYYADIDKRVSAFLPKRCEPNQELNVLNALQKINEVIQNSWSSLKDAVGNLYGENN